MRISEIIVENKDKDLDEWVPTKKYCHSKPRRKLGASARASCISQGALAHQTNGRKEEVLDSIEFDADEKIDEASKKKHKSSVVKTRDKSAKGENMNGKVAKGEKYGGRIPYYTTTKKT